MLDFHYSDTWADPGHQRKPVAWTNLVFAELVQEVHDYSSNCIATFKAAGAMPDYVQIGNEITSGMLWPDGRVGGSYDTPQQWSQLGELLKAAAQGIKDGSAPEVPRILIHIDRGGDWAGTQWFFDNLLQQEVPFDIIGESYYPFWHGPLANLANCLTNAAQRYQKPVVIAETAFPWTNSVWSTGLVGLSAGPDGQVQFVAALASVMNQVPHGLAGGIFWWGAEYQKTAGVNEAGFDTTSFFDSTANVLPVAGALGQMTAPLTLKASLNSSKLNLNWPLSGGGLLLKVASRLAPIPDWQPVTNSVVTNSTGFNLTLPVGSGSFNFYQLQSN
jgi:arabinogalactan endo-1,4-beta-galactosidase